ncbi:MAG: sugar phosphate isomerase/epimerase [Alphaproteobacteria bacterium]|nr:sugar phosphate isomerase/epimerase [Alphaproteobacteria bacterium]
MSRLFSLAHLSLIESPPAEMVMIAAKAGFDLVDLRLAPATPTDPIYSRSELAILARDLAPVVRDAGLRVWDVEIIRIKDQMQPRDYLPLMEAAAHLGAARMKLVCDTDDHARAAELLAAFARAAAPFELTLDLEYMVFSGVKSLKAALGVVEAADQPNLRVLVDALHWTRAGDTAEDIRKAKLLDYVQLCDAPATAPVGREALIVEARTSRLPPGEGALALDALLDAMPPLCVASLEVPLPRGHDPMTHARTLLVAAHAVCAVHDRVAS